MATETVLAGSDGATSEVRIQLSTKQPDISITENPGAILVGTSNMTPDLSMQSPTN